MRRIIIALAAPAAAAVAVWAAAPALAAAPTVSYTVGTAGGNPASFHVTIDSNPNNNAVRAYAYCPSIQGRIFGSWHTSIGATSNTANCPGSFMTHGGFQYRKSDPVSVECWIGGDPRQGFC